MKGKVGAIGLGIIMVIALIFVVLCATRVPTGYKGVVYSINGGVNGETLSQGWHLIAPGKKVKMFTVGNEQLLLTKDKREGSTEDEAFKVSTSDDASIAISFQMSYRFLEDKLVDTYKKFKGMNGEDIVNSRIRTVLKSKISEITTNYSMMNIYSGDRSQINDKLTEYLNNEFLGEYGIQVIDASIVDAHPDEQLQKTIDTRVAAIQKKQQAQAEQETAKVEAETAKIQAQKDADVKKIEAQGEAEAKKIEAQGEAEANKILSESITQKLIDMKLAEARQQHGWVTVNGASTVVTSEEEK
jgi:regulator of protease activity HflC (stomatin/prohibitin superfamily)